LAALGFELKGLMLARQVFLLLEPLLKAYLMIINFTESIFSHPESRRRDSVFVSLYQ
jgi:hypothetical protein